MNLWRDGRYPGLTKPIVWAFWFHVVGFGVGEGVATILVVFAYTTRGVSDIMGSVVAATGIPVLTGWPVANGLITNAITRIIQNAATM
jgi:hypothetical protein